MWLKMAFLVPGFWFQNILVLYVKVPCVRRTGGAGEDGSEAD